MIIDDNYVDSYHAFSSPQLFHVLISICLNLSFLEVKKKSPTMHHASGLCWVGTKPGVGHGVGHGLPVVNFPKNQNKLTKWK